MTTYAWASRPILWSAALGLFAGCGAASPPEATPPPSATESPESAPSVPLPDVMGELVEGQRSLASLVEPERGLVYVLWKTDPSDVDPRRDEDGLIRVAERLCGDALEQAIARLDQALRARGDDPAFGPSFTCEGDACRHRARMEFDVEGTYVFESVSPPRLAHIVEIEGQLTDEARADAERWAKAQLARLRVGACD